MDKTVWFSGNAESMDILSNCLSAGGPKRRDEGAGDLRYHGLGEETTRKPASEKQPDQVQK